MSLKAIRDMQEALKQKIQNEGKALLGEAFKKFFAENPEIEGVRWRQYTPYFNDGEPCTFGVHEFYYSRNDVKVDENETDYGDEFVSAWSWKYRETPLKRPDAVSEFESAVSDEQVLLGVFGDHVQVTATREGFEVEEYSHD